MPTKPKTNKHTNTYKQKKKVHIKPELVCGALMHGDMPILRMIKKRGFCHLINKPFRWDPDEPPTTLFLMLCHHDELPVCSIEWMIRNGADLRTKDEYGANAMHYAVAGKCPETVCALWRTQERHWLLHEPNNDGNTAQQMIEEDNDEEEIVLQPGQIGNH